jgi:transcriptional regulator with XRE-family HTH domain
MTTATATKKRENANANKVINTMTEQEVIALMRMTQGDTSLRAFATKIGVTPAYVSDIYNGRRSPGPGVLKFFGIGKERRVIVEYIFFKK